MLGLMNQ